MESSDSQQLEGQSGFSQSPRKSIFAWLKYLPRPSLGILDLLKAILRRRSDNEASRNQDAKFMGWQKTSSGEVFALYNVVSEESPLHHSTVSAKTLREQKLNIPQTPSPPGPLKQLDADEQRNAKTP